MDTKLQDDCVGCQTIKSHFNLVYITQNDMECIEKFIESPSPYFEVKVDDECKGDFSYKIIVSKSELTALKNGNFTLLSDKILDYLYKYFNIPMFKYILLCRPDHIYPITNIKFKEISDAKTMKLITDSKIYEKLLKNLGPDYVLQICKKDTKIVLKYKISICELCKTKIQKNGKITTISKYELLL